ncbi:hypothetical protein SHIRM173S_09948 [Streptomyces hirsutus]
MPGSTCATRRLPRLRAMPVLAFSTAGTWYSFVSFGVPSAAVLTRCTHQSVAPVPPLTRAVSPGPLTANLPAFSSRVRDEPSVRERAVRLLAPVCGGSSSQSPIRAGLALW